MGLRHLVNRARRRIHNAVTSIKHPRSPKWHTMEKSFLKAFPECANPMCRSKTRLNVHHVKPYHLFPELELHWENLRTLCMSPKECHLKLGHGGNFKTYNGNLDRDLQKIAQNPEMEIFIFEDAKRYRKAA